MKIEPRFHQGYFQAKMGQRYSNEFVLNAIQKESKLVRYGDFDGPVICTIEFDSELLGINAKIIAKALNQYFKKKSRNKKVKEAVK